MSHFLWNLKSILQSHILCLLKLDLIRIGVAGLSLGRAPADVLGFVPGVENISSKISGLNNRGTPIICKSV